MAEGAVQNKAQKAYAGPVVANIRRAMARRSVSAYWLAKRTGIDYMTVRRLLDYKTGDVMLSTLVKIAEALEVDICEIVGGRG
ncbi:helix-turn-helix transcriptional regulator [Oceanithermus sp.]|uniref:helix-turn-helix domain-containing protein n=1 Tax=Oceanithermus sp. TaxID=2268145 RepID=UPI0025DE35BC|nr:helix-turn-helix transcriptional regulator [Oceanithermus sp.]